MTSYTFSLVLLGISSMQTLIIAKGQLVSLIGNPHYFILIANDQVSVFKSRIINIVTNFIPNETITCDD